MSWKTAGDIAFYACTIITVLFALLYLIFAPWWKTMTGRNIMAVMGSVALAFGYFTWVIFLGGVPAGFYPMRALIFAFIALAIGWRTVIFARHHVIPGFWGRRRGVKNVENER